MLLKIELSETSKYFGAQNDFGFWVSFIYIYIISVFSMSSWSKKKMDLTQKLGFEFLLFHWWQNDIGPCLTSLNLSFLICKIRRTIIHEFETHINIFLNYTFSHKYVLLLGTGLLFLNLLTRCPFRKKNGIRSKWKNKANKQETIN